MAAVQSERREAGLIGAADSCLGWPSAPEAGAEAPRNIPVFREAGARAVQRTR